jgi:hypothetical protein
MARAYPTTPKRTMAKTHRTMSFWPLPKNIKPDNDKEMYEPILFLHSWTRWAVFLGVIYFFIRSVVGWWKKSTWTSQDGYFIWAFNQAFGYQVAFGITLWIGLSPMTKAGMKDPPLILENDMIFFWVLRHALTMILALGAFHIGKARSKKVAPNDRFKVYTVTFAIVLLMIVSAIPWPWLSYGRTLFRWFF